MYIARNYHSFSARDDTRQGLTLTEVVVSTLLVGAVVVGALSTLGASVRTRTVARDLINGPALADALLAEIMAKEYDDPQDGGSTLGLDSFELVGVRTGFDDVDDYDNWSPAQVQDRQGIARSEYAGWTRTVTVNWANPTDGDISLVNTGLKRIEVTVTAPDGTVTRRFGIRSREGSLEQSPTVDKNVVIQIESALTVGSASTGARGITNLLNHVEDPNAN